MKTREVLKKLQDLPEKYLDAEFSDKLIYGKIEELLLAHYPQISYIYNINFNTNKWYILGNSWSCDLKHNFMVVEKSEDGKEIWIEKVKK